MQGQEQELAQLAPPAAALALPFVLVLPLVLSLCP
jgi:hypothetical protein